MLNRVYHSSINGQIVDVRICGLLGAFLDQTVSSKIDGIVWDAMESLYTPRSHWRCGWMSILGHNADQIVYGHTKGYDMDC